MYFQVRSQAGVLKKAVLDEQAKTTELKEIIRNQEQTLRKHDQEMESLIFRNEQVCLMLPDQFRCGILKFV